MRTHRNSKPVFELFDNTLAGIAPDVLGLWTTLPLSSAEAVAFDRAPSEMSSEIPVWRVNFPTDLHSAATHLAEGNARLEASQKAMKEVPDRLETFVQTQLASSAFDISSKEMEAAQPEAQLLALLSEIQTGRPPVSFGLGEKLVEGWQQTTLRFQTFVDQLLRSISHYAWVETCVQEQFLGRTSVSWTGNMNTLWREGINPVQLELHQRTLALALASRNALFQTIIIAVRAAVQLSALFSMPGGSLFVLPAAWKFVNQILAEVS